MWYGPHFGDTYNNRQYVYNYKKDNHKYGEFAGADQTREPTHPQLLGFPTDVYPDTFTFGKEPPA
jgi:hypothetical protein